MKIRRVKTKFRARCNKHCYNGTLLTKFEIDAARRRANLRVSCVERRATGG